MDTYQHSIPPKQVVLMGYQQKQCPFMGGAQLSMSYPLGGGFLLVLFNQHIASDERLFIASVSYLWSLWAFPNPRMASGHSFF